MMKKWNFNIQSKPNNCALRNKKWKWKLILAIIIVFKIKIIKLSPKMNITPNNMIIQMMVF